MAFGKRTIFAGAAGLHFLAFPACAWPPASAAAKAADRALTGFSASLAFSEQINPTPASAAGEKEKFFSALAEGRSYEPRFRYSPFPPRALKKIPVLEGLKTGGGPYAPFLEEARSQLLAKAALLQARGTESFPALSAALFRLPSEAEVEAAERTLEKLGYEPPARPAELSGAEMAGELSKALAEAGLKKWKVRISPRMSASASVTPGARRVNIKKGRRYSRDEVKRLVLHEIGVHALRAENGYAMPLGIFRLGLEGYLETEEGMAAYNEWNAGMEEGLRLFALRVLAVDWASRLPFSGVFSRLTARGVPPELAWTITQRVKRGMTDTGRPGCYGKDVSYFRGYLTVKDFMEKDGSWDELMRYGKVSMGHLPALRALAGGGKGR
ncbi:MAG: DUF1704 domain-containing protein [Elusimicrobiales bacterium]|nr:DUF1704 domain-containing protein [Elusimicrobiales bacterium]